MRRRTAASGRCSELRTSSGSSMIRSNITGTTHSPVAWWRSIEFQGGLGVELAAGHDRARQRRGEDQLRESPRVEHRRGDDDGLFGAPRRAVQNRLEDARPSSPPECLAPLGVPVVPDVSRMTLLLVAGALGFPAGVLGDHLLDRETVLRAVGPRDDPRRVRRVGQRAVDGVGELLVVDDGVGAFPLARPRQGRVRRTTCSAAARRHRSGWRRRAPRRSRGGCVP